MRGEEGDAATAFEAALQLDPENRQAREISAWFTKKWDCMTRSQC